MAWAICRECGCVVNWPKKRGMRLSYLRCPKCGGQLMEATVKEVRQRIEELGGFYSFYADRWIPNEYWTFNSLFEIRRSYMHGIWHTCSRYFQFSF